MFDVLIFDQYITLYTILNTCVSGLKYKSKDFDVFNLSSLNCVVLDLYPPCDALKFIDSTVQSCTLCKP